MNPAHSRSARARQVRLLARGSRNLDAFPIFDPSGTVTPICVGQTAAITHPGPWSVSVIDGVWNHLNAF
jgi:hypothetical protein